MQQPAVDFVGQLDLGSIGSPCRDLAGLLDVGNAGLGFLLVVHSLTEPHSFCRVGKGMAQGLFDFDQSLADIRLHRHHCDAELFGEQSRVQADAVAFGDVDHVECQNHRLTEFDQFQCQHQVPFKCGGVDDVEDQCR